MAGIEPYHLERVLDPEFWDGLGDNFKERMKYSMFPVSIRFRNDKIADEYNLNMVKKDLAYGMMPWDKGIKSKMIDKSLRDMAVQQCIQITKICTSVTGASSEAFVPWVNKF